MTVYDAIVWIDLHKAMFGTGPTYATCGERWVLRAGELCRNAVVSRKGPVTDEIIRKELGIEKLADNTLL